MAAAVISRALPRTTYHSTFPLRRPNASCTRAGGVLLSCSWLRCGGDRIGTAGCKKRSSPRGRSREVVLYKEQDFVEETDRITDGEGVNVVYDPGGQDNFDRGLDVLRPRGYMVLFGASSGPVEPIDPQVLNQKGGLYLTRPALAQYSANREELYGAREPLLLIGQNNSTSHRGTYEPQTSSSPPRSRRPQTTGKLLFILRM